MIRADELSAAVVCAFGLCEGKDSREKEGGEGQETHVAV